MATVQNYLSGFSIGRPVDLSKKDVQQRLSGSALAAFFRLVKAWRLRDEAARNLLGGMSNGAFYQLKRGKRKTLDQDRLTRVSILLGIFKALNILYSRELADSWITRPNTNPMFAGEPPVDYMVRGGVPALMHVRQLLDARRGGK